jgi:hypothetical protein
MGEKLIAANSDESSFVANPIFCHSRSMQFGLQDLRVMLLPLKQVDLPIINID